MDHAELENLLWSITNRFNSSVNKDDLFGEAQLIALKAIRTYDHRKKTKLKSYIITCVQNRFKDLNKARCVNFEELDDELIGNASFDEFEICYTMEKILSNIEYQVFKMKFVEDCTVVEIAKKLEVNRREVYECLQRILRKYVSLEKSLKASLSMRRLQNNWLEGSPN